MKNNWKEEFRKKFKGCYMTTDNGGYVCDVYIEEFIEDVLSEYIPDKTWSIKSYGKNGRNI